MPSTHSLIVGVQDYPQCLQVRKSMWMQGQWKDKFIIFIKPMNANLTYKLSDYLS